MNNLRLYNNRGTTHDSMSHSLNKVLTETNGAKKSNRKLKPVLVLTDNNSKEVMTLHSNLKKHLPELKLSQLSKSPQNSEKGIKEYNYRTALQKMIIKSHSLKKIKEVHFPQISTITNSISPTRNSIQHKSISLIKKQELKLEMNNLDLQKSKSPRPSNYRKPREYNRMRNGYETNKNKVDYTYFPKRNVNNLVITNSSIKPPIPPKNISKVHQKKFTVGKSTVSTSDMFNENDLISAYAYITHQGILRDYNEDTISSVKINDNTFFFGLYDGHGGNGCSLFLKDNLYKHLNDLSIQGIEQTIKDTEQEFFTEKGYGPNKVLQDKSGSCAVMTIISENKCVIVNIGDSRCIIIKNNEVYYNTMDHKPNNPSEKERITNAGGKVYQNPLVFPSIYSNISPEFQNGPFRVAPGRLSVSRTIGDILAKDESYGGMQNVVISTPDVFIFELTKEYEWIILGCDGIFDVLSNEDIIDCIQSAMNNKASTHWDITQLTGFLAKLIIRTAMERESIDNVSCIVIAINPYNI